MADSVLSILVKFAALDRLTQPLRTMSGASKAASRDLAAARKDVLALEKQAAQIGGFKDQQAAIAKSHAELDTARKRVTALRAAIQQADGPTGRLTRSLEAATGKVARLDDGLQKQVTRLGTLRTGLSGAGIDVTRLADAERRLETSLTGANRKLEEQQAKAKRAAEQAVKLQKADELGANLRGAGTRGVAIGAAIGAPLIAAAARARDFQSGVADIAINAGLTERATARIASNITRLAPKLAQAPIALQAGLKTLVNSGLDVNVAQKLLAPIGRTATAQKADVDDLAKATFAVYNNLGVPVGRITAALDAMTTAGKKGGVEIRDMADGFPALTAAAAALGQSGVGAVSDLSAALQVAKDGAGNADEAITNLQNVLTKLNTRDSIANFKKFGVDLPAALKKAYAEGKTPLEAIAEITNKTLKGDTGKISFLFGDQQAQAGLRSLITGLKKYRKLRDEANRGGGVNQRDFNRRLATDPAAKQAAASSNGDRLGITVGTVVNPALTELQTRAGEVAGRLSDMIEKNPQLSQGLILLAGGAGIAATGIGALSIGLGIVAPIASRGWIILSKLGPGLRLLLSPIQLLIRGLLFGLGAIAGFFGLPVWLVGAIAVGIGLAALAIYNHWATISGGASALWTGLTGAFNTGLAWLRGMVPSFSQIGHSLLQGLLLALNPLALVQHILKLGGMAVTALKGVLGIKSPSRVFGEIGGHMMTGLTMGLDRGVDQPLQRLRRAGAQLAGVTASAVSPTAALAVQPVSPLGGGVSSAGRAAGGPTPAGQGSVHHHTYQITVAGGPGVDMRAQARELMEEIKRLQATERAASYQDDA